MASAAGVPTRKSPASPAAAVRSLEGRAASADHANGSESAAALGTLGTVRHRGTPHRVYRTVARPRLYVTPGVYGYPRYVGEPLPAQIYYPTARGFEDPGYAYHSNISGCATDLGYGRWESCDK